jgi:hypothetical protein
VTPAAARDLATIMDPAAGLGQLADVLYRRAVSWGSGVNATDLSVGARRDAETSDLLAQTAYARLHEQQPCAGGCRRLVWPACGVLCEECWLREEELERVRGYLAEAVADEHKIGPYANVAPGVFDILTPENWFAHGRQAGLVTAACEAERRREANAGDPRRRQAWAAFANLARWCRRRAEE